MLCFLSDLITGVVDPDLVTLFAIQPYAVNSSNFLLALDLQLLLLHVEEVYCTIKEIMTT